MISEKEMVMQMPMQDMASDREQTAVFSLRSLPSLGRRGGLLLTNGNRG